MNTEVPSYGLFNWFGKNLSKGIFGAANQATNQTPAPAPAPAPAQKTYRDFDWSDYNADRLTRDVDERDQYYDNFKRDRDFWGSYYNSQPAMAEPINYSYGSFGGRPYQMQPYRPMPQPMGYGFGGRPYQMQPMPYRDPYGGGGLINRFFNKNRDPYGGGGIINGFFNKNRDDRMRDMAMGRLGQPSIMEELNKPQYGAYVNPDGSENEGGKFMDFQDRDNDGYDDRYQLGPGHKPGTEYQVEADPIYETPTDLVTTDPVEEPVLPPLTEQLPVFSKPKPKLQTGLLSSLFSGLLGNAGAMAKSFKPRPVSPLSGLFTSKGLSRFGGGLGRGLSGLFGF